MKVKWFGATIRHTETNHRSKRAHNSCAAACWLCRYRDKASGPWNDAGWRGQ